MYILFCGGVANVHVNCLFYYVQVGDKMPDTGAMHLPSYLDKSIMYSYLKADLEDDNEEVIHYSTFCHLLADVFPHVKIPKV